jgi:four helix bundle protein
VWRRAIDLVKEIYALTASFPRSEQFGLLAQMRRAAVAVPSNIAEGAARASDKEFTYFLHVARASLSELETQPVIAEELGFGTASPGAEQAMEDVFSLLAGLIRSKKEAKE